MRQLWDHFLLQVRVRGRGGGAGGGGALYVVGLSGHHTHASAAAAALLCPKLRTSFKSDTLSLPTPFTSQW